MPISQQGRYKGCFQAEECGKGHKFQAEKMKADFNEEVVKRFSIYERIFFNNFNSYY